jgi:hypothetical protein
MDLSMLACEPVPVEVGAATKCLAPPSTPSLGSSPRATRLTDQDNGRLAGLLAWPRRCPTDVQNFFLPPNGSGKMIIESSGRQ